MPQEECLAEVRTVDPFVICSDTLLKEGLSQAICPYKLPPLDVCGDSSIIEMSSEGGIQNYQSKYGFFNDYVCMYEIMAPEEAPAGSYIYFEAISLIETKASLFISENLWQNSTEQPISCEV